jgi:hypothetical protein
MNLLPSLLLTTTLSLPATNVRICLLDLIRTHDDFSVLVPSGWQRFFFSFDTTFDECPIFFFTLFFILDAPSLFL